MKKELSLRTAWHSYVRCFTPAQVAGVIVVELKRKAQAERGKRDRGREQKSLHPNQ